jgi:uncharacterized protein (TIGR03083 family)
MESPKDRIKLLQVESERLTQYLGELPLDALDRPSKVNSWRIGDVVGHLCFGSDSYLMFLDRALDGDSSTPEGFWEPGNWGGDDNQSAPRPDRFATASAKIDEAGAERWARFGDELIPTVIDNVNRLSRLLGGLSASDLERLTYHLVFGVVPIKETLIWWITELAQHAWDFRSIMEPETRLSVDSLPTFMTFMPTIIRGSFRRGDKLPQPRCFRFELTSPFPSRNDIVVYGNDAQMTPASDSPADTTVRCDVETFSLLLWGRGRLGWDTALAAGRAEVEGDRDLIPKFAAWFPGT